ncbi:MAG: hypothetical protein ACI8W3_002704, partial [Myxococcota bacterium]
GSSLPSWLSLFTEAALMTRYFASLGIAMILVSR